MPSRGQTQNRRAPARNVTPPNAVVVFDADEAARQIKGQIERRSSQFAALLSADEGTPIGKRTIERFTTVAIDAIISRRDLLEADQLSLVSAVRQAAQFNLEPSGVLGDGVIVAYRDRNQGGKKIAQFQPMYRGLAKLARRSPTIKGLDWQIVYEKDLFRLVLGSEPRVEHERYVDGDPGSVKGAYLVARLASGELVVTYMSTAQIHKVRDSASRAWREDGETSLWGKWAEEMMLKTVVKRGLKKLPLETIAQAAVAYDDEVESVRVSAPPVRQLTGLRGKLGIGELEAGEAGQNGSGRAGDDEPANEASEPEKTAQEPSTAATEPTDGTPPEGSPAEPAVTDGSKVEAAKEVEHCGAENPYDEGEPEGDQGGPCVKAKGHRPGPTHGGHKARNGATW